MTGMDVARLREVAEKATPGPWWLYDGEPWYGNERAIRQFDADSLAGVVDEVAWDAECRRAGSLFHGDVVHEPDAEFIAACDPPTVLALLDALADREARLAAVETEVDKIRRERGDAKSETRLARKPFSGESATEARVLDRVERRLRTALHPDPSEAKA